MSRKSDHVTYIELGFSGTFDWHCSGCNAEATAFETAAEVLVAAQQHGPLAADSLVPSDEQEGGLM